MNVKSFKLQGRYGVGSGQEKLQVNWYLVGPYPMMHARHHARQRGEFKNPGPGTSLVAQWLRIHPPKQETRVRALAQEDPTCRGATKPTCHNY